MCVLVAGLVFTSKKKRPFSFLFWKYHVGSVEKHGHPLHLPPADLYCTLEVDSFGYFVNKAKTRVYRDTTAPNWNEVRLPGKSRLPASQDMVHGVWEPEPLGASGWLPPKVKPRHSTSTPGISWGREGEDVSERFYLPVPENRTPHHHLSHRNHLYCQRSVFRKRT